MQRFAVRTATAASGLPSVLAHHRLHTDSVRENRQCDDDQRDVDQFNRQRLGEAVLYGVHQVVKGTDTPHAEPGGHTAYAPRRTGPREPDQHTRGPSDQEHERGRRDRPECLRTQLPGQADLGCDHQPHLFDLFVGDRIAGVDSFADPGVGTLFHHLLELPAGRLGYEAAIRLAPDVTKNLLDWLEAYWKPVQPKKSSSEKPPQLDW